MDYVPTTLQTHWHIPACLTPPAKFLLPLSSLVERRTIEEVEDGERQLSGQKYKIWGVRWKMGPETKPWRKFDLDRRAPRRNLLHFVLNTIRRRRWPNFLDNNNNTEIQSAHWGQNTFSGSVFWAAHGPWLMDKPCHRHIMGDSRVYKSITAQMWCSHGSQQE